MSWPIPEFVPPDQQAYLQMMGVDLYHLRGVIEDDPWSGTATFCEEVDDLSGAVCTERAGHPDNWHRDASDPSTTITWGSRPELYVP